MSGGLGLLIVFGAMILIMNLTKKLYFGIVAGCVATALCFGIPLSGALALAWESVSGREAVQMVLILIAITFLQRMLEQQGHLVMAQRSLDALVNNRRINTCLSPMIIGLLPSAAVVKICGDIVDESAGEYLDREEKAFVASFYRHTCESFMPTYTSILVALSLSGVSTASFIAGMVPVVLAQIAIGYFFYLRKLPKDTGVAASTDRKRDILAVFRGIWSLALIIVLILAFSMPTLPAVLLSEGLYLLVSRIDFRILPKVFLRAFEARLIVNMVLIYIFKDLISHTGVIGELPALFSALPIPQFLIYMLIFIIGAIVGGANMIAVIGIPIAFAAIPDGGMPLLVLLSSCSYIAMQISPTHVCLAVVTEHFGVTMGALVRKSLPVLAVFLAALTAYYLLLQLAL